MELALRLIYSYLYLFLEEKRSRDVFGRAWFIITRVS
jgi:hypothetical protein